MLKGVVAGFWQVIVDLIDDFFVGVRAGDCQYIRVHFANFVFLDTQATRYDYFAVFFQCFTNGVQ